MAAIKPTKSEVKDFKFVMRRAEQAGLVVPEVGLRIVRRLKGAHGQTVGNVITIERSSFSIELLCHEVAHIIASQIANDDAAAHNRFWALTYGVLYQSCIQK